MRRIVIAVTTAAAILLVPASAQATPPTREPVLIEDFILTDHCGFDIDVEVVKNNEIQTTYYDADGNVVRQRVTGSLKVRLTNLEDPEHSVLFNISGPGETRELPDGSERSSRPARARWLQFGIADRPGALLLDARAVHGRSSPTRASSSPRSPNNVAGRVCPVELAQDTGEGRPRDATRRECAAAVIARSRLPRPETWVWTTLRRMPEVERLV